MKQSIIHDCDPGNDDALGIFVAAGHPTLDLLAVTTGAGHLESNRTARNAAIAVAAAGLSVPVAAGATRPLVRERLVAGILDFELGLDRERPDLSSVALDPRHSADLIAEIALARPGLVIACSGPMTNLALALRRHPGIGVNIGRIVALGGAWGLGNKTAAAEWNILSDPEAASIVYGAGIPVVTVPIDAAACVGVDDDLVSAVGALEGAACELAVELLSSLRRHPPPRSVHACRCPPERPSGAADRRRPQPCADASRPGRRGDRGQIHLRPNGHRFRRQIGPASQLRSCR